MAAAAVVVAATPGQRGRPRKYSRAERWPRGILLAMSAAQCTGCGGLGGEEGRPCYCVLRRIFRAVWEKVQRIQACESRPFHVQWSSGSRQRRPWCEYSRQNEEFIADFELIARRTLTPRQHRIFRLHVLLGADWRFCAPRVGLDRGQFYHEVYRIQERLGRAFRETRPYGLFPVDEYFVVGRRAA